MKAYRKQCKQAAKEILGIWWKIGIKFSLSPVGIYFL
jgi:hypothetical protein